MTDHLECDYCGKVVDQFQFNAFIPDCTHCGGNHFVFSVQFDDKLFCQRVAEYGGLDEVMGNQGIKYELYQEFFAT